MKKKRILISTIVLMLLISIVACKKNTCASGNNKVNYSKKATEKLNYSKKTINRLEHFKLKVKGNKGKVKWESSNKNVATVKKNGMVYGVGKGKCNIIAKTGGKKYICKVVVKLTYGTLSGNISYYYNDFKGYVPDTGAKIFAIDVLSSKILGQAEADGNGNYMISHLPVGMYEIVISSAECKSEYVLEGTEVEEFQKTYGEYLNVAGYIEHKYCVEIYKGEETVVSHAFPFSDW